MQNENLDIMPKSGVSPVLFETDAWYSRGLTVSSVLKGRLSLTNESLTFTPSDINEQALIIPACAIKIMIHSNAELIVKITGKKSARFTFYDSVYAGLNSSSLVFPGENIRLSRHTMDVVQGSEEVALAWLTNSKIAGIKTRDDGARFIKMTRKLLNSNVLLVLFTLVIVVISVVLTFHFSDNYNL